MEEHIKESIALGENKMITKPVAKIPESFDYTGIVKEVFQLVIYGTEETNTT